MASKQGKKRSPNVWVRGELLTSASYSDLEGKAAQVLMWFMMRRQMVPVREGKKKVWACANDGEIVFTYKEAEQHGISRAAFMRAVDELIEHGFLDIAKTGAGVFKATTFYGLSDRWRNWGTDKFVKKVRPRKPSWREGIGFEKGHSFYPSKNGEGSSK